MAQSDAGKNRGLDGTITPGDYVSLHWEDPGSVGVNEAAGGGYARQPCSGKFAPACGGRKVNSETILFRNLPSGTWSHFGIFDEATGGEFIWGGRLVTPVTTLTGDSVSFEPSAITATYS